MSRVLIIGLDGATWNIIKPLADGGKLPTFKKLMSNGTWGTLKSTVPPVTGPSWVSFATGLNPGKTGVFDFLVREEESVNLTPINSKTIQGRTFWGNLSSQGYKVGIMNFPMLYPPYKVNGFMVSGAGSPDGLNITFPRELKDEIDEVTDGYELMVDYHNEKYNFEDLFLKDLNRVLTKKVKAFYYLLNHKSWDMFLVVFSCTDWVQHFMWKYLDTSRPSYNSTKSKVYRQEFLKIWQKIDRMLNRTISICKNANVLIVSDHGFGPQLGCFYVNLWLEKEGFLVRKQTARTGARMKARSMIKRILRPFLLVRLLKRTLKKLDISVTVAEQIDFKKSTAFALGHTIPFGAIYINVKGRAPYGFIERGRQYDGVKEEICRKLMKLGQQLDRKLDVVIFDPNEIYEGDKLHLAPDIIFTINNWGCVVIESFADNLYTDKPYSNRHTGSHRMNGIFLAYGPDIKKGKTIEGAKIYDIAPTVLHMYNSSIPKNMDGQVLTKIFLEKSKLAKQKIKYVKPSDVEKRKIRERIKKLKKAKRI
jgi:predicted AlkP superfamily phosphohydrolase/phosphomutase